MNHGEKERWAAEHILASLRDPNVADGMTFDQLHHSALSRKDCPPHFSRDDVGGGAVLLVQGARATFSEEALVYLNADQLDAQGGPKVPSWTLLRVGAVGMLDALGFKGVWMGENGERDLRALATLRWVEHEAKAAGRLAARQAENLPNGWRGLPFEVGTLSLSDTLIFHVGVSEEYEPTSESLKTTGLDLAAYRERLNSLALLSVVKMAAAAMRVAIKAPKPLTFRGAIAVGAYLVEDPFLIGPCMDDAGKGMEAAEGPFVWFRPSALAIPSYWESVAGEWHWLAREYEVPMKQSGPVATRVVDPGVEQGGTEFWRAVLATMPADNECIARKRVETEKFARYLMRTKDEEATGLILGAVLPSPYLGAEWE